MTIFQFLIIEVLKEDIKDVSKSNQETHIHGLASPRIAVEGVEVRRPSA